VVGGAGVATVGGYGQPPTIGKQLNSQLVKRTRIRLLDNLGQLLARIEHARFHRRLRDSNDLGDFLEIGCTTFNIRMSALPRLFSMIFTPAVLVKVCAVAW
jgi:hypothetical protein